MELKLGAHIAALRKSKGMTQEQLAMAVGVSAPAVSKWETDTSCPDIALLCPLARALGTNVDTLLRFEETPSDEQLMEEVNKVIETAREEGCRKGAARLENLLHTYPSSISLKYFASIALSVFEMLSFADSTEKREDWKKQKKMLLEQVRGSGVSAYWQSAVSQLAAMALADDQLEEAERLLKELPEQVIDPTLSWARLYLKRGEGQKAREAVQKRLFLLVRQIQSCLLQLMDEELEPDVEKQLEVCEVYRGVETLFEFGAGMGEGFLIELYRRAGQKEKARDSLIRFVDAIIGSLRPPKPVLFSSALKTEGEQRAATEEMLKKLLDSLRNDGAYAEFRQDRKVREAMEKLERRIGEK